METLTLETDVLNWAAEQVGESLVSLSESIAKRGREREAIQAGRLTPKQAERFASITRVPFGFLFLDEPPDIFRTTLPDLRQATNATPLSDDFHVVLEDARRKQQWFRDYLKANSIVGPGFVGSFKSRPHAVEVIAAAVAKELRITGQERRNSSTQEDYFSALAKKAEGAGILVLKSGIVRSNTRRALSPNEFRGFAIADPLAPLVFINGKDWQVAWVFTLMHEIAHVFIGESGVSDLAVPKFGNMIEAVCNATAAEILVPRAEFLVAFDESRDLTALAKQFKVSRLVVARRALEFELIAQSQYNEVAKLSAKAKPPPTEGGGSAYANIPIRNSRRLTQALVNSAASGRTLYREAARLLNVKPDTVANLAQRMRKDG